YRDAGARRVYAVPLRDALPILFHRYAQVLTIYRRAAEHAQAAYEKSPNDILAGRSLAVTLRNVSLTERRLGLDKAALKSMQQARSEEHTFELQSLTNLVCRPIV